MKTEIDMLDYYIHVLQAIIASRPVNKPLWSIVNNGASTLTSNGDDNYALAKILTVMGWVEGCVELPVFTCTHNNSKSSNITMMPSGVAFLIYNEKMT